MGTTYHVKIVPHDQEVNAEKLKSALDKSLGEINQVLSTYIPDSELSKFNRSSIGNWQPASAMLMSVVKAARGVFIQSNGAFDPTVGPLVNLWGFGPEVDVEFPADKALQAAKLSVGFDHLEIDSEGQRLRKKQELYLDLSAIAKGYGVDYVAGMLDAQGLNHYLVEIGGELRSAGLNAESQPWRIAIEKPQPGTREVHGVLNISDKGMATSGDYRNFFEKDGRRYSHTIDPRTGFPVEHSLVSVTVLADDAMAADAMATALMVMGTEAGYALAASENMAVWFIEKKDQQLVDKLTPKMQNYRLH